MDYKTKLSAEKLIERGYCKISNRYRLVARIDREDWVSVLANELRRAPADFYVPGEDTPAGNWADYYRRTLSADVLEVVHEDTFRKIPSSNHNPTGFVKL